jgi:hypothetical protein
MTKIFSCDGYESYPRCLYGEGIYCGLGLAARRSRNKYCGACYVGTSVRL